MEEFSAAAALAAAWGVGRVSRARVAGCAGGDGGEHLAEGCGDGVEEVKQEARPGELLEEEEAEGGEDEVGGPDSEGRRELAGFGEGDADVGEEVVGEDEEQGEDDAGALASALGGEAEGDADEHEDEAGEGIGEADVEFDAGGAGVGGVRVVGLERAAWARCQSSRSESAWRGVSEREM